MPGKDVITTLDNEVRFNYTNICVKEEDGEFYSEGFIATTHPDRAADPSIGVVGDVLSKSVLHQIADAINSSVATIKSIGSTRTVSLQHDWIKEGDPDLEPAGMAMPPAEVREYVNENGEKDGHYGVWVKTHHNKTHPKYKDIIYNVQHGYFPGYSIEYEPGDSHVVTHEGQRFRFLQSIKNFVGYAFAAARKIANPSAIATGFGYKEIEAAHTHSINEEDNEMVSEEEKAPVAESAPVESQPEAESKEASPVSVPPSVSVKEIVAEVTRSPEYKEALNQVKVEKKTLIHESTSMPNISIKEMNEALSSGDSFAFKESRERYLESVGEKEFFLKALNDPANFTRGFNSNLRVKCVGKGLRISGGLQVKGTLGTGDNTSSYTQADVEFADLFAPGIIDTFNNQTNLFGFLRKEQHIGGEHYQWKMITSKDPAGNSTFVSHNDTSVLKNFSSKSNYQTPLKIARRGVSVTDFTNRYAARSLGDLFALEVDLQMKEMMNDVNAALFAEVADGAGNAPLGLEAVADSAGNTTLYGLTRSVANRLAPDAAGDTYLAVGGALTEAAIRAKVSHLETEGTRFGDIAIIASPTTRDYLLNLLDGNRRFNTTEAAFGFNKATVATYDGIPIIVDADCNSDALYFIDTEADVIVVGMEPRIVSLAKVGAATEAYVQMDFAHVYKQPRRIGMLDTLSGP